MATVDFSLREPGEPSAAPAFLVLDTESVPDGRLISLVKYPDDALSPEEAVRRAQEEARQQSSTGSDFLPPSFQVPVAICVARVGADFRLQAITCLDAPLFRTRRMVEAFWNGIAGRYKKTKIVSFNGRGFDLPLLELAAFRYGCSAHEYFYSSRNRYNGHLDLLDWLCNYGGCRLSGGLNLLSKILGKPGKMETAGDQVYAMAQAGQIQAINDYCMFDTLDTYFVFLRTRVLTGDLNIEQEHELVVAARAWIQSRVPEVPALQKYLDNWGDWKPWP